MQNNLITSSGHKILSEIRNLRNSQAYITVKDKAYFFVKTNTNIEHFENEIQFQKAKIGSAHVLQSLGMLENDQDEQRAIVYPLIPGNLAHIFDSADVVRKLGYIQDIAKGVSDMHSAGFYHGDIKIQNVLISNNTALLCDFGTSRPIQDRVRRLHGSLSNHQPPDELWDLSADTYALGVLLYQTLFGYNFLKDFVFTKFTFPMTKVAGMSTGHYVTLTNLIRKATAVNSHERIPISFFIAAIEELFCDITQA